MTRSRDDDAMSHNSRPGKGSCGPIQLVGQRRRKGGGMMMGRIEGFEGCRLVGVGVVGNRIGPWKRRKGSRRRRGGGLESEGEKGREDCFMGFLVGWALFFGGLWWWVVSG